MVDINLLPEDLRKKEEQEKKAAQKLPHGFDVKFTVPQNGAAREKKENGRLTKSPQPLPQPKTQPFPREQQFFQHKETAPKPVEVVKKVVVPFPMEVKKEDIRVKPEEEKIMPKPVKELRFTAKAEPERKKEKKKKKITSEIYEIGRPRVRNGFWSSFKNFFSFLKRKPKSQKEDEIPPLPLELSIVTAPKQEARSAGVGQKQVVTPIAKAAPVPQPPATPPKVSVPEPARSEMERPLQTLEINLIPEEVALQEGSSSFAKRLVALTLSIIGSMLFVSLVYGGLKFYEERIGSEIEEIDRAIAEKRQKITEYEKDREEVEILQSKLILLDQILSNHVYWTRVFEALERYTVEDVYFTSFTASRDGGLIMSAVGRDYTSVARQLVAFQEAKDFAIFVDIRSANASTAFINEKPDIVSTNFSVQLKMVPDIFLMTLDEQ